ncbi:MAG: hypothetical protein EP347_11665 [Alphaproteobacteria bacterium]|nr:MAG: hypothetical protein EP347_11665 [Alphaproteobacteria bacterium]
MRRIDATRKNLEAIREELIELDLEAADIDRVFLDYLLGVAIEYLRVSKSATVLRSLPPHLVEASH